MNKYQIWKEKAQKKIDAFPIGFAFNDEQFRNEKEKLGVKSNDELFSIGCGGFIRKKDEPAFVNLLNEIDYRQKKHMEDYEFVFDMFYYELANHEYCITGDLEETFDACGLTAEEVNSNEMYLKALKAAVEKYNQDCDEYNN